MAVGGGVILAASYEARAFGVQGGMGGARARYLCPELVVVPPRWPEYVAASRTVFEVFRRTSPLVEGLSIDEAFLDVRGMERSVGSPTRIALRLRWDVRDASGLPITVGVATTKSMAKIASALAKPDGLMVVPAECELDLLHGLPVARLWGVGPATAARLRRHGLERVGDLAALGREELVRMLGARGGAHLHALSMNHDPRPVRGAGRRRSFGAQSALGPGPHGPREIDVAVIGLVDRVTRRMRQAGRTGRTVILRLRFGDYTTATRSRTLARPTSASGPVLAAARALLAGEAATIRRRGLTLVGVTVTGLADPLDDAQMALEVAPPGDPGIDAALDAVRDRFGPGALTRASLGGRDPGLAAFMARPGSRRETR